MDQTGKVEKSGTKQNGRSWWANAGQWVIGKWPVWLIGGITLLYVVAILSKYTK
jgi:hypothetical protein